MPGIGIGVSFEFHEVNPDGSFCTGCGQLIITSMHKLYLSVNTPLNELGFELLPTKYQYCEACKITFENDKSN